jgi:hypothetical protein
MLGFVLGFVRLPLFFFVNPRPSLFIVFLVFFSYSSFVFPVKEKEKKKKEYGKTKTNPLISKA